MDDVAQFRDKPFDRFFKHHTRENVSDSCQALVISYDMHRRDARSGNDGKYVQSKFSACMHEILRICSQRGNQYWYTLCLSRDTVELHVMFNMY